MGQKGVLIKAPDAGTARTNQGADIIGWPVVGGDRAAAAAVHCTEVLLFVGDMPHADASPRNVNRRCGFVVGSSSCVVFIFLP